MRLILVILLMLGTFVPTASYAKCERVIDCYERALSDLKQAHDKIKALNQDAAKKAAELEKLKAKYEAKLEKTTQALVNDYQARLQQLEEGYTKRLASTSELADLSLKLIQQAEQKLKAKYEAKLEKTTQALVNDYQARLQQLEEAYTKRLASTSELADFSLKSAQRAERQIKAISTELNAALSKAQMVFNSVANEQGANAKGDANTLAFWQIPYQDRFKVKGIHQLGFNYYNPTLYQKGPAIYVDVVEGLEGKVAMLMIASADGIDPKTMKMIKPKFLGGNKGVYNDQFASGWSSDDYDGDTWKSNCATEYGKVTQHYGGCWNYNLGADTDSPRDDKHWGPHLYNSYAQNLNLKTDGSSYTRLRRITRYIIF